MNRKKKVVQTLKQKAKKANAKLNPSKKPRYISKAERAKMAELAEVTSAGSDADKVTVVDSESATEN